MQTRTTIYKNSPKSFGESTIFMWHGDLKKRRSYSELGFNNGTLIYHEERKRYKNISKSKKKKVFFKKSINFLEGTKQNMF